MVFAGLGAVLLAPTAASGEIASALLREDDELIPGETISSLNNTAVNHVGGYACSLNTTGTATISRIWGEPSGGLGMLMRSEMTIGVFEQTSFESFYGMGDAGQLAYGTSSRNIETGETGLDGVWVDDLAVLHEEDPVPSLPGMWSNFNSRPTSTGDGTIVWVGGFADDPDASTQNRALFSGLGSSVLIMGGDSIPGISEPVDLGGSIDFDFRVSRFGTNWIDQVLLDASSSVDGLMVINSMAVMAGGSVMREGSPVPAPIGGLPDELWDNFDFLGINEAGDFFVTGDTNADSDLDEFVTLNGEIILREGDVLDWGGMPATLSGSIEGGYMNRDVDWAVIWDIDDVAGTNLEALIFNGEILLVEGDLVDWNGDGMIDAGDNNGVLANFTGISALTVGARVGGVVNIYFTADIDFFGTPGSSDDLEGFFCLPVQVGPSAIPVTLDIKRGACPPPFNPTSNGVLPTAVIGTDTFDVTQIDLSTVVMYRADGVGDAVAPNMGPPGPAPTFNDLGGPSMGEPCDCDEGSPDGITDLSLKFRSNDLAETLQLEDMLPGEIVELCVSGLLTDGTPFIGCDCVWLVPPGGSDGAVSVESNLPDVWVETDPVDDLLDSGGFTNFRRFYSNGTVISIKAPEVPELYPDLILKGWWINGQYHLGIGNAVTVTVTPGAPFVEALPWYGRRTLFPMGLQGSDQGPSTLDAR
jgi:hypothetical protein